MPRGVKRAPMAQQSLFKHGDPYPEHAKLYPHTEANWQIREFCHHLGQLGLIDLDWDQVNDALLAWRGVDRLAYEAEAADMRSKYRWLWDKFEPRLPELAQVIDETKRPGAANLPERTEPDALQDLLGKLRKGRDRG